MGVRRTTGTFERSVTRSSLNTGSTSSLVSDRPLRL
jgi:hypothetical protein